VAFLVSGSVTKGEGLASGMTVGEAVYGLLYVKDLTKEKPSRRTRREGRLQVFPVANVKGERSPEGVREESRKGGTATGKNGLERR